MIRLIFSYLNLRDRYHASLACQKWYRINLNEIALYSKAQLIARYQILEHLPSDARVMDLMQESDKFLYDPKSDVTTLKIPSSIAQPSLYTIVTEGVNLTKGMTIPKQKYDLCVRMQDLIVKFFTSKTLNTFRFFEFDLQANDDYEHQAIIDSLKPAIIEMYKRNKDKSSYFPHFKDWYITYPVFCAILETQVEINQATFLPLSCMIRRMKHVSELKNLEQLLPRCKSVEKIYIANYLGGWDFVWSDAKGLNYLKKSFVVMPRLKTLQFRNLKVLIDECAAEILADLIITRSLSKKCTKIEEIQFLSASITPDGGIAFLKALKNYPYDIGILFGPDNHIAMTDPFGKTLFKQLIENKHLQVRLTNDQVFSNDSYVYIYKQTRGNMIAVKEKEYKKYIN